MENHLGARVLPGPEKDCPAREQIEFIAAHPGMAQESPGHR